MKEITINLDYETYQALSIRASIDDLTVKQGIEDLLKYLVINWQEKKVITIVR